MIANARSVKSYLKEKARDPRFRELMELEEEKAKIASLIVRYRIDHHLNQAQLAKKVGVTQQYISKVEEGDFSNLATVWRILRALGYCVSIRAVQKRAA